MWKQQIRKMCRQMMWFDRCKFHKMHTVCKECWKGYWNKSHLGLKLQERWPQNASGKDSGTCRKKIFGLHICEVPAWLTSWGSVNSWPIKSVQEIADKDGEPYPEETNVPKCFLHQSSLRRKQLHRIKPFGLKVLVHVSRCLDFSVSDI